MTFSTFSQFITQNAKTFKITSNQQNLNLRTWANASEGSGFWENQSIPKIFIIQPSVTIYSLDRTIPALTIPYINASYALNVGPGPHNKVIIINYGDIIAGGGLGASTSTADGGPAISVQNYNNGISGPRPAPFVDIYNFGNIYGGAGAGGRGGEGGQGRTSSTSTSTSTVDRGNSGLQYNLGGNYANMCQEACKKAFGNNAFCSVGCYLTPGQGGCGCPCWSTEAFGSAECNCCKENVTTTTTTYTYYDGGDGGSGGNGAQYNQSAGTGSGGGTGGTNAGDGGDGGDGGALGQPGTGGDTGANGNYSNGLNGINGGSVGSWLEQGTEVVGSGTPVNVEQTVKWVNYGSGAVYGSITHPNVVAI